MPGRIFNEMMDKLCARCYVVQATLVVRNDHLCQLVYRDLVTKLLLTGDAEDALKAISQTKLANIWTSTECVGSPGTSHGKSYFHYH